MLELKRNVLSETTIADIFHAYSNLSNTVFINGLWTDRHWPSFVGHFLVSKFTNEEFDYVWEEAKEHLPESTLIEARVLKYSTSSHIPPHLDMHEHEDSDLSVIIQLNHPDDYKGGDMTEESEIKDLNPGDMVYYTYDYRHGVNRVKKGSRYVVNLRLKLVK